MNILFLEMWNFTSMIFHLLGHKVTLFLLLTLIMMLSMLLIILVGRIMMEMDVSSCHHTRIRTVQGVVWKLKLWWWVMVECVRVVWIVRLCFHLIELILCFSEINYSVTENKWDEIQLNFHVWAVTLLNRKSYALTNIYNF